MTVQISDGQLSSSASQTVTVLSPAQGIQSAMALVDGLVAAGKLVRVTSAVLKLELNAAKLLLAGDKAGATTILRAVITELDGLVALGRLSAADAAPLRSLLVRIIQSIG